MGVLEDWKNYTLEDIYKIDHYYVRKAILFLYHQSINELVTNRIDQRIIERNMGKSYHDIYTSILYAEMENRSMNLSPGDIMVLYPQPAIIVRKATKSFLRQISGARIPVGQEYLLYRPFIENLTTGKKYVLKHTIRSEIGYEDFFPNNIHEFEELDWKLSHPYSIEDGDYNYQDISKNIGEGLYLQQLGKRKIKEK